MSQTAHLTKETECHRGCSLFFRPSGQEPEMGIETPGLEPVLAIHLLHGLWKVVAHLCNVQGAFGFPVGPAAALLCLSNAAHPARPLQKKKSRPFYPGAMQAVRETVAGTRAAPSGHLFDFHSQMPRHPHG